MKNEMDESKMQFLSLAQLESDADELVGFRPNVDANAFLPPIVHTEYEGLLRFDDEHQDPDKRWTEDTSRKGEPKKYFKTMLQFVTDGNADESVNGRDFAVFASTLVRRGGTTSAQAALQGCGVSSQEIAMNSTRGAQAKLINKYCDGGGTAVTVEIDWEASYFDTDWVNPETGEKEGKEYYRLRGMERFPVATEGEGEYEKSIAAVDGSKRYYPWIDLDITDMTEDNPVPLVVFPDVSAEKLVGRNIKRCFVRNFMRRFKTRTVIGAVSAGAGAGGVSERPALTQKPSAPEQGVPAMASTAPTPAATGGGPRPGQRPAPVRR
jgi:hypothetical protein